MKLLRSLALSAVAACLSLSVFSSVEAASVALLPLVNNVAERADLNSIYYDRAIEAVKLDPILEVAESTALDKALKKYVKDNSLPDKAACKAITEEAGIDYVFVMQADKLEIVYPQNMAIDHVNLLLRGRCVSFDANTGKYVNKLISEEDDMQISATARYDVSGNQFGNSVTREIKKALHIKKFVVEKQRIGNFR